MTRTPSLAQELAQHPLLAHLSANEFDQLAQLTPVQFRVGQDLLDGRVLPGTVYALLDGEARLLLQRDGRSLSVLRLGPGAFVGAASLQAAMPLEWVTAATDLLALPIPDQTFLRWLLQESEFSARCSRLVNPAELLALMDRLNRLPVEVVQSSEGLGRWLRQLMEQSAVIQPRDSAGLEVSPSHELVLASANVTQLPFASLLAPADSFPQSQGVLPARVLSIPAHQPPSPSASSERTALSVQPAPLVPPASALDLGQRDAALQLPSTPLISASGSSPEILACFQMVASALKLPLQKDAIRRVLDDVERRGQRTDLRLLGQMAANLGLHVVGTSVPAALVERMQVPALLQINDHFAVLLEANQQRIRIASPAQGWISFSPRQSNEQLPETLEVLLLERSNTTPNEAFGPQWFWPALRRYRGLLLQVLLASFVVQLFSLANPLLIQVIIDKVISQRSLDTLQVLGIALVVVTLLEGVIGSLRTFLFSETTNRIDLRLGSEVIDHLLRLPLHYFERRPVGELATRISELEKIRNFLTGQALTTILDAGFSVIYIIVMALYSWVLTVVALAVLPIQVGLTFLGAPLFRRQFRQAAEENARTQSHLVEVLSGIQTVKAQNVEMISRWKWQELYSSYIGKTFQKTVTGTTLNETSQVLQKLSQLLVLWVGAYLVLQGQLTLGQLIAFRIISGYVTQPLLRLSTIWQNIQELRVSFERLADVVNTPEESTEQDQSQIPLPPLKGDVVFDNLNFAFDHSSPLVLKNINLTIPQGTFVGVVGQSGSGKSTLMKLLSRLYDPTSGRILIDHYDIAKVQLYSLRRQIGIVPQDPLLFSGSVSENISLADPDAPSDEIVSAAAVACAHEFIMDLTAGYATQVGERGSSLSGGQRQRVAIARTLLSKPKMLVMDEATSALDYDTERRVCDNLRDALHDCTVFFVTHRLSTIRNADLIVMMHQGAVVETGTHDELIARKGRYYALYRQQEAG